MSTTLYTREDMINCFVDVCGYDENDPWIQEMSDNDLYDTLMATDSFSELKAIKGYLGQSINLKFKNANPGFMRVYFTAKNRKGKNKLYCFQRACDAQVANHFSINEWDFFSCSKDGEPSHPIHIKHVRSIESFNEPESVCIELATWLDKNHKSKVRS